MNTWLALLLSTFDVEAFNQSQPAYDNFTRPNVRPEDIRDPDTIPILSKWASYAIGGITTGTFWILLLFAIAFMNVGGDGAVALLAFIFSSVFIFLPGFRNVEMGWKGVPRILGTRVYGIHFGEGIYWIPWFLMTIETVNTKQQFHDIHPNNIVARNDVKMHADTGLTWRINHPYLRLITDVDDVAGAVMQSGKNSVISVIRSEYTDEEAMGASEEIARKVAKSLTQKICVFGGTTDRVYFESLLPDQRVIDARQLKVIEKAQREAEMIEINFLEKALRKLISTGLSPQEALEASQTERSKVPKTITENKFSVDAATSKAVSEAVKNVMSGIFKN